MPTEKVLITVKTYPNISAKYEELVCTAGFREDGSMIRIYPVRYRPDNEEYKKYDWIEIDLEKRVQDFRPESFHPVMRDNKKIKVIGNMGTENNWAERKEIILRNNVYTDLEKLISDSRNKKTSLAVFKPKLITKFEVENYSLTLEKQKKYNNKVEKIYQNRNNLFPDESKADLVNRIPYKFSYKFTDCNDKMHKLMIVDWETGALYRKYTDETIACYNVKRKYEYFIKNNDIYFFLGTTLEKHNIAKNPFIIIGVFYPPKIQAGLF